MAVSGEDSIGEAPLSPDSGINELQGLTPEEQEKQKQTWAQELAHVSGRNYCTFSVFKSRSFCTFIKSKIRIVK